LVFGITAVFLSPTRSTVASQIDFPNLHKFLDALTLMYRVTTRLAGQFHHTDDLREIRARQDAFAGAVPAGDTAAMILLNRDFHVAIAKAGQNPYYLQLFLAPAGRGAAHPAAVLLPDVRARSAASVYTGT